MLVVNILRYFFVSLVSLVIGGFVGCLGGLALGWLLALGYEGRGPSDPGDAPAYVALGLMLLGGCLGAVAGLIVGIVLSVRSSRSNATLLPNES
jgi:hypothetical protein